MAVPAPSPAAGRSKPTFGILNEHLICTLCSGYLVDATTIIECLHSFCRSCIVQYLQSSSVCPCCKIQLDKGCPLRSLKPDKTLQDIVYKLVPNLFSTEMQRRKVYYDSHPQYVDQTTPEQRGDSIERFYSPDDSISLSLEYHGRRRLSLDSDDSNMNLNNNEEKTVPPKRYLKCPAMFTIGLLKKFIRLKFDLPNDFVIDIFQRESYPDEYTLLDIAYIYPWKRSEPMRFFYHVRDPRVPECEEDGEREMPALSAAMGVRASRMSRRVSAASPLNSPRASPAPTSRKSRGQLSSERVEQSESGAPDGLAMQRSGSLKTTGPAGTPTSLKSVRSSPTLKNAKPLPNIAPRGLIPSSTGELPPRSPKLATDDSANKSRCGKTECLQGQKCGRCIADTPAGNRYGNTSMEKSSVVQCGPKSNGHGEHNLPFVQAKDDRMGNQLKFDSSSPKGKEIDAPKSDQASINANRNGESLNPNSKPSTPRNGDQKYRHSTGPNVLNGFSAVAKVNNHSELPKETSNLKQGIAPSKPPLNGLTSNKIAVSSSSSVTTTSARSSVPSVTKTSFTTTLTTKTANGGFVTVKNPVARTSNGASIVLKNGVISKPPPILPKMSSSAPQAPVLRTLKSNVTAQGNQKQRRVNSPGLFTNTSEPKKYSSGVVNNVVNSNQSSQGLCDPMANSPLASAVTSTTASGKTSTVNRSSVTSAPVLKARPNMPSKIVKSSSSSLNSAGSTSVPPLPKSQNTQNKEHSSDEEKKVETAKAILQLSMGFKRCSTPTDAALHNRIDKIVKDLQKDDGNCNMEIKTEPISPNPSPNQSPRASPAPSLDPTLSKDANHNTHNSNQALGPFPKVNGLTITPIDAPKRKATSSPVIEEKRMKLQETSSAGSSLALKRPADAARPSNVPQKIPKVDKIAENIKQKQEMLLQQHRDPLSSDVPKSVPSPQQQKVEQNSLPPSSSPSQVGTKSNPEMRQGKSPLPQQHQQMASSQQENGAPSQTQLQPKVPLKPSQQKTPLQSQTGQLNVASNPVETKPPAPQLNKKVAGKTSSPESPIKSKKPIPDLQRLQRPPGSLANTTVNGSMSLAEVKEQLAKNGQYSPPGKQRTPPRLIEISQQRKSAPPATPSSLPKDGYGALDLSSASPRAEHGGSWTPPPSIAQTLAKRQQQLGHRPSSASPPADSPELFMDQSFAQQQALLQHLRLQSLIQAQAAGLKKAIEDWATVDRIGVKTSSAPKRK